MLVTHSLTDSLTDLIDVTLACEDAYSKLVKVVTISDVMRIVLATVCYRFES